MSKILKEKSIFKSKLFNIKQTDIKFGDKVLKYEIISGTGNGAVLVVPIIDDEIIFIKEYAAAIDNYMITFPKGKIDQDESIHEAANRELQEEIGYKSNNINFIKKIYLAPGYIDHITYIMFATDLEPSALVGDEPEELEQIKVHKNKIQLFLEEEEIIDSRVYAALNYLRYNDKT
tara:strand:- start:1774 stop:2301 length:528 start_codon:yes stop_codon:yes gene_type:complete